VRALDLRPELEGREHQRHADRVDQQGEAPHVAQGQEGHEGQDPDRRREEERLAAHEVERREVQPLGDGRASGHEEDEARNHERGKRREQRPVDGPPPIAEGRAFRA
jgi:hypothetical protein